MTPGSGIDFVHRNGEEAGLATILESLGGGVALIDYDGDGLLDVFCTGGGYFDGPDKKAIKGHPCKLYANLGGFKFRDVTAEVGLDRLEGGAPWFYTHGAAVADYDNDGWPDLLVTGYGRLALFHNTPDGRGQRRFVDVTRQAGLNDTLWSTGAGWGDLDGDGLPDLYVCHYVNWSWANNPPCKDYRDQTRPDVCAPKLFEGLPHALYRNNGNGTFTEVGAAAGLQVPRPADAYSTLAHLGPEGRERLQRAVRDKDYGKGLGVLIADLDDDGRLDIYVANDTSGNFVYLNRGRGHFEQVGAECGAGYDANGRPTGSMGVDAADYNGTGLLSLFVANYQNESHALYRNRGKGQFVHASQVAGITSLGLNYVGFRSRLSRLRPRWPRRPLHQQRSCRPSPAATRRGQAASRATPQRSSARPEAARGSLRERVGRGGALLPDATPGPRSRPGRPGQPWPDRHRVEPDE